MGASPDGLIENNGIVEVKCPSSAEKMTPHEAACKGKAPYLKYDKKQSQIIGINKKHVYYYQVQGQLHVTGREYCLFAVWTPLGLHIETVFRDDQFWKQEMEPKLSKFYFDCLLPELIDPRFPRSMPIRNPDWILQAQEAIKTKKEEDILKGN